MLQYSSFMLQPVSLPAPTERVPKRLWHLYPRPPYAREEQVLGRPLSKVLEEVPHPTPSPSVFLSLLQAHETSTSQNV